MMQQFEAAIECKEQESSVKQELKNAFRRNR